MAATVGLAATVASTEGEEKQRHQQQEENSSEIVTLMRLMRRDGGGLWRMLTLGTRGSPRRRDRASKGTIFPEHLCGENSVTMPIFRPLP